MVRVERRLSLSGLWDCGRLWELWITTRFCPPNQAAFSLQPSFEYNDPTRVPYVIPCKGRSYVAD
ncbi:hypothetical protein BDW59DRAFT_148975 [Aspergillus cavernicola]|uniref:Uncharacterized protein n=1 Tax=Aspergillus cavernicola TaxID=176166 RepID=A0ABR4I6E1_9EURO